MLYPVIKRSVSNIEDRDGMLKYPLLVMPATAFALGTWQVFRLRWKLNLIAELKEKTSAEPIDFPDDLGQIPSLEYRPVRVKGRFIYDKELYLTPKSLVHPGSENQSGKGLISIGQTDTIGSWVVTPFQIKGTDKKIMVNRGWVPRNQVNRETRKQFDPQGEIELIGIVRKTDNRPPLGQKNTEGSSHFRYRDVDTMASRLDTLPIFLDATASLTNPAGGPIAGQTRVTLRNDHASYILTWYGLGLVLSYLWYIRFARKRLRRV